MSSGNNQITDQMPKRYHSNNAAKSRSNALPGFAQSSRRQIGLSDPDVLEYIKQANNASIQQSGISTKSDIVGEINTLNSHIKDQKWRAFDQGP